MSNTSDFSFGSAVSHEVPSSSLVPTPGHGRKMVQYIQVDLIDEFPGHPFLIHDDKDMENLVSSIKEQGVLSPVIVRENDNARYDMISGHRRLFACQKLDLPVIPCIVVDIDDDEAIIRMVESNIQRSSLLPSEKAKSYKMLNDAYKHQGKVGSDSEKSSGRTTAEIGRMNNDSSAQVTRYIRMADLIDGLLNMVDKKKVSVNTGYTLSFLSDDQQQTLLNVLKKNDIRSVSIGQAKSLKDLAGSDLDEETILTVLQGDEKKAPGRYSLNAKEIKSIIEQVPPEEDANQFILNAIQFYKEHYSK